MSFSSDQRPAKDQRNASPVDASRFWAVLIGIDMYSSRRLSGCVADTKAIEEYLTKDLGVQKHRIQRLFSTSSQPRTKSAVSFIHSIAKNARTALRHLRDSFTGNSKDLPLDIESSIPTRANIIDTLLSLSTNSEIENEYLPYEGTSVADKGSIEALSPIDRTPPDSEVTIPDISDREINSILKEISRTKGHRITLILDCCHSSGVTRSLTPQNGVRSVDPLPDTSIQDMLDAAHIRLRDLPGYRSVYEGDWHPDMDSHVVLAACREYENAKERKGPNGNSWVFTQALIHTLKHGDLTEESTYLDLVRALKLPTNVKQTPIVAGKHKEARLWYQDSGFGESSSR
ncbi:hypothetical protein EV421DRAFT_2035572 [Armillaria borealis]|uniref:Peptidase C14 caspase domain-containing protein n=1 Tax=Armillaria borealis TaxID=47425 RepID=A0AA39MRN5_9AGAR|nr:hypothetical protein EV421DRAFT_2035572 [Armillaria borealis]